MTSFLSHEDRLLAGQACLDAAMQYLTHGLSVLCCCDPDHIGVGKTHAKQCATPGKSPVHTWKAFQARPPTVGEVRRWWVDFPYGNVGCVLGQVSGLVRVDVDGPEGEAVLAEWSAGDLPATWTFRSSSTGRGLLYGWPHDVPCRTTVKPSPGDHAELRLMANGSQTILPPSRHASGRVYAWDRGCSPQDVPAAQAPRWVVERLRVIPTERPAHHNPVSTADYARVIEALTALPNHDLDYDCWLKVGMALHSTGQPWARDAWETWSQHSAKYNAEKQEKSWQSFQEDRNTKATLGTLFYLAQQAGWQPPRRTIPDMTQPPQPPALDPTDPAVQVGALAHRLPDHLRNHPDTRVQQHWRRIYRKANALKQRYLQDPYAVVLPSPPEGASHGH